MSDDEIQEKLDAAMPYVGIYIAAASVVCVVAMAADAFNGHRLKKPWVPCKFSSLNAASLTVLAVTTKLSVDLNSNLVKSATDRLAKLVSMFFMSTAMANFMPSLGSMTDKELLANVVALGILVTTIVGNVCIQLGEVPNSLGIGDVFKFMVPMVFSFATLASLAVSVPAMKRSLESKFQEKHGAALREEEVLRRRSEAFGIDDERECMLKYLVMAETSSPQFVIARSIVCSSSAIMCFYASFMLLILYIDDATDDEIGESAYGSSTQLILYIQSVGVVVGTIVPFWRLGVTLGFRFIPISWENVRREFIAEAYWTQILVEWRDRFTPLQLRENRVRKFLHDVKWFALTFCIGLQMTIVLLNKLLVFLWISHGFHTILLLILIKTFAKRMRHRDQDGGETNASLSPYVLVLEGEPVLPTRALKKIVAEADGLIKRGNKKQPKTLVVLLRKFVSFKGVGEFDQIQSLHSQEPPNSWALPIVTLTSIAVALPNIAKHESRRLLSSVGEGLSLVKIVEKTLVQNTELVNIKKAADICWVGVALYKKWLDFDLETMSVKCESSRALLLELSKEAESIMVIFKIKEQDSENPLNWPPKVLAANSMYRITQTILLSYEDEGLYERLSVMIADILAACLTNIPRAITEMCHRNAIEKRESSVRKAFFILGNTEQVVQLLQQKEWPNLDGDKATHIDEWRALFQQP